MAASLKAGLIGAAVAVVMSLLGLVPCLGCLAAIFTLVLYVGVGVLAAAWMEPPREPGKGAQNGAIAGLITAVGGGVTSLTITALRFTVGRGQATLMRQLRQLPPELLESWRDLGLDPRVLARPEWAIGSSTLCCGLGLLLAAALGAAAGALTIALRQDRVESV